MTRTDFALGLITRFRREKQPPFTKYAVMLAAARRGADGGTRAELAADIGEQASYIGTVVDRAAAEGLLRTLAGPKGQTRHFITDAGTLYVADLLNSRPATATA